MGLGRTVMCAERKDCGTSLSEEKVFRALVRGFSKISVNVL